MQADNFFHRNANFVLAGSAKECKKESWNDIVKKFLFGSDQEEPTQGKTLAAVVAQRYSLIIRRSWVQIPQGGAVLFLHLLSIFSFFPSPAECP